MRLIDADKLKIDMDCNIDFGGLDNRLMILGQIDNALTVEERKVGKWIEHKQKVAIGYREFIACPFCKCWFGKWELPRNSYCPNCGAEMRGYEHG